MDTEQRIVRVAYTDAGRPVEVIAHGDGSPEHFLDTFRAIMVAAGYSCEMAKRLVILDER